MFWRLNRSTKRTDVLFYFSDFQNRQKTGISYSPIPESVDPFKMIPEMYQLSNPFDFSVSISGLHTSYLFAIGYCAILIIQYVVLLYIMNQFTMCLKDYFHLRKTTLEKHFQRMSFSFWLLSGTVIGLQILNSVLAQHVRLFKPDFLIEVIVVWFLAIAFHYVASIIVNINKFVDN
ncbi:hypothetical protein ABUE38_10015 [Pediococcus parvulus]|uniref:hypothetical protein n=1 Tax=Pediococcus parvulus TaxID=54062 RepID=UPI003D01113A